MPAEPIYPLYGDVGVAITGGYSTVNPPNVRIYASDNTGYYNNNYPITEAVDYRYLAMQREIRKMSEEIAELKKELVETEKYIQNEEIRNIRKIKV